MHNFIFLNVERLSLDVISLICLDVDRPHTFWSANYKICWQSGVIYGLPVPG